MFTLMVFRMLGELDHPTYAPLDGGPLLLVRWWVAEIGSDSAYLPPSLIIAIGGMETTLVVSTGKPLIIIL